MIAPEVDFASGTDHGNTAHTFLPAGRNDHLPAMAYHTIEALNASAVPHLLRSAAHFHTWRNTPFAQTPEMAFGEVVHALVLEPERDPPVAIAPDCERRSIADKATWAEFEATLNGRVPLKQSDFDRAQRVRDAVYAHPAAQQLLTGISSEVSLFWYDDEHDIACKARLDALRADGGVIDMKTTRNAGADEFARSVAHFCYHAQAAHYGSGCEHVLNASPAFYVWIAVETEPPFGCCCYEIDTDAQRAGLDLVHAAAEVYAQALREGRWPGYADTIQLLRLPKWALRRNAA